MAGSDTGGRLPHLANFGFGRASATCGGFITRSSRLRCGMKRTGSEVPIGDRGPPEGHAGGRACLVELDPDHPGFKDAGYRARRDAIARLALDYVEGSPIPDVAYTDEGQERGARCGATSILAICSKVASRALRSPAGALAGALDQGRAPGGVSGLRQG